MGELDETLGAVFIAGLLAAVLYGLTLLQTFLYSQSRVPDGLFMKLLVLVLWGLDTLHMVLTAHGLYFYLVTNFGQAAALAIPTWSLIVGIYLTSLTGIVVRIFFARRIFSLCGRYRPSLRIALPVLVMIPTLVTFVTGIIFASKAFVVLSFALLDTFSVYLYVSFATSAFADTLIAASLCFLLYKSRTGMKKTDSLLTTLIIFTINTGLLTSVYALLCLITYSIWPRRFVFVGMYFSLCGLYVNSLLGSLNARGRLRARDAAHSVSLRSTRFDVAPPTLAFTSHASHADLGFDAPGAGRKAGFGPDDVLLFSSHSDAPAG